MRRRDSSATAPLRREARERFVSLVYFFTCVFSSSGGFKNFGEACVWSPTPKIVPLVNEGHARGSSKLRRVIRVTLLTGGFNEVGPTCRPEKLVRPVQGFRLGECDEDCGKAQALTWARCRVGDFVDAVLVHSSPYHSFITCINRESLSLFAYPENPFLFFLSFPRF